MKNLLVILLVFMIVACNESNNSGSSTAPISNDNSSPDTPNTILLTELYLDNEVNLIKNSTVSVQTSVTNLLNDDAIYMHIESVEIDNGTLQVEPKDSIIYPTEKTASLYLLFTDKGLLNTSTVTVKVVTATGQEITRQVQIKVGG